MDLSPTISISFSDRDINRAVEKIKRTSPDISVSDLANGMIDAAREVMVVSASRATFLDDGIVVEDFEAVVSLRFVVATEIFFVLDTGDVINYSMDAHAIAGVVMERYHSE